jgi:hypothetical protein
VIPPGVAQSMWAAGGIGHRDFGEPPGDVHWASGSAPLGSGRRSWMIPSQDMRTSP